MHRVACSKNRYLTAKLLGFSILMMQFYCLMIVENYLNTQVINLLSLLMTLPRFGPSTEKALQVNNKPEGALKVPMRTNHVPTLTLH